VLGVSDEENTFDRVSVGTAQSLECIDSRRSTLGVTLEDEAVVRIGPKRTLNAVDNVDGAYSGDLGESGRVDGVVNLTTAKLLLDLAVHASETGRRALKFTGTTSVDQGVSGARLRGCTCDDLARTLQEIIVSGKEGRSSSSGEEKAEGDEGFKHVRRGD